MKAEKPLHLLSGPQVPSVMYVYGLFAPLLEHEVAGVLTCQQQPRQPR